MVYLAVLTLQDNVPDGVLGLHIVITAKIHYSQHAQLLKMLLAFYKH